MNNVFCESCRMLVRGQVFLLAFFVVLAGLSCFAEPSFQLSIGHIVSHRGASMAAELLRGISANDSDVQVYYDFSLDKKEPLDRFLVGDRIADLPVVYVGTTGILGEVEGLVNSAKIQPIETLPDFQEMIKPEDFYRSLLQPVEFGGHIYAMPLRVVVPIILKAPGGNDIDSWDSFFGQSKDLGLSVQIANDYYNLWRTILMQLDVAFFSGGRFSVSDRRCHEVFQQIASVYFPEKVGEFSGSRIILGSSDLLADNPDLIGTMRAIALPGGAESPVFCSVWSWYVAVNSSIQGPARVGVTEVLSSLASVEIQKSICEGTYSAPLRLSQQSNSKVDAHALLAETVPRLRFRDSGRKMQNAEEALERAFLAALEKPLQFDTILGLAVTEANQILERP